MAQWLLHTEKLQIIDASIINIVKTTFQGKPTTKINETPRINIIKPVPRSGWFMTKKVGISKTINGII